MGASGWWRSYRGKHREREAVRGQAVGDRHRETYGRGSPGSGRRHRDLAPHSPTVAFPTTALLWGVNSR